MTHRWAWQLAAVAALGGCTDDSTGGRSCSVSGVTGAVPGITLAVRSDRCVYHSGEPATFTYELTIGPETPTISLPAQDDCRCMPTGSDPRELVSFAIAGELAHYCECERGCCPPTEARELSLPRGTFTGTLAWPGLSWNGPSDTDEPLGPPFPPGDYTVKVAFDGLLLGVVQAELGIEIVP